jgi:predicted RNA-binding protein Jag
MKVLEIEGKTIDEAIDKACREFDVPREKLNIEILSEGSSGFFGLVGTKKAKIKASLLSLDMSFELPKEKKERAPERRLRQSPRSPGSTRSSANRIRPVITGRQESSGITARRESSAIRVLPASTGSLGRPGRRENTGKHKHRANRARNRWHPLRKPWRPRRKPSWRSSPS